MQSFVVCHWNELAAEQLRVDREREGDLRQRRRAAGAPYEAALHIQTMLY